MKQVEKIIVIAKLDEASATAKKGIAQEGVQMVVELLNNAKSESDVQFIMDGATERGFVCQFYPVNGHMGVRVTWGV